MQKWQYFVTTMTDHVQTDAVNEFGKDGWELVSVVYNQSTYESTLFFKRPLK